MPTAVITGISGQDGYYLAEHLLSLGQAVVGTTHRSDASASIDVGGRLIPLRFLDLSSAQAVDDFIDAHRPDALYNLAARASSAQLFDDPLATTDINGVAVARLLEAIRRHSPRTRLCQASSSEIFAGATRSPQDEHTPRAPLNAYGAAKLFADHMIAAYRHQHGLFACSAILYPHESPRRPHHFLVRKVTHAAARAAAGLDGAVALGDLAALRDWGYAPDVARAMALMIAADVPRDFVIATGVSHSVEDVCRLAFAHVGLDWRAHVTVDGNLVRPQESVRRVGDATLARTELGWAPSLDFAQMIGRLVDTDRTLLSDVSRP